MIKCESIGGKIAAKNNPTITANAAVENYTFLTYEGTLYLIVKSLEGLKLVVDGKHITFATNTTIADIAVGNVLTVGNDGKLAVAQAAPESGVYFKVTKIGVKLTEAAVEVKVFVA